MKEIAKLGSVEKEFERSFLDTIKFDSLRVDLAEVDSDGRISRSNANVEGVVELSLRYATIADFIKSRGGKIEQDLVIDSESEEVVLYLNSEDSACVAVDCSVTLREDMTLRQASKAGVDAAKSINAVIKSIIDFSASKKAS